MFTRQQFLNFDLGLAPYLDALIFIAEKYSINTPMRMAHFLAQIAHESGHFKTLQENLNYSAQGLANTWPSRFAIVPSQKPPVPNALAYQLQRQASKIANYVYANRLGNGDLNSGDGGKFIGRGFIQLTGRDNYTKYSFAQYGDDRVVASPLMLMSPPDAAISAAWFWKSKNINAHADNDDLIAVTKAVNGGIVGIEERGKLLVRAKNAFGVA